MQAQSLPDQLAGTEPSVYSGTYTPCNALNATNPTINCDMYELEGDADNPGRLRAIVWDDKDGTASAYTSPALFVENGAGVQVTTFIPMAGYDPDVIILDNLNNPGVDYYIAVAFWDGNDVMVAVYNVFNANSSMSVSMKNVYTVASGSHSAPHLDGWPDPQNRINGQPSLHEFALVHTDNADQILLYKTDISAPSFSPWPTTYTGRVPDIAAQTDVLTGTQFGFTTYTDLSNPSTSVWLLESDFTMLISGIPNPWQTATQVYWPRIEAIGLTGSNKDRIRWQIANIGAYSGSGGWEIYGHNSGNPSFSVTPTAWDFFSPAVAAGLGPLGPVPSNLGNRNFVINYFKAADNIYSTDVSMLSGGWSGNSYRVNMNPIYHPISFPKFVAVSSCSNSGLNLLSAWYDGSGTCANPGNGNIWYKESPGNSMAFKTTGVIDLNTLAPSCYPNPAKDRLYLAGLAKGVEVQYHISDLTGRSVQEGIYNKTGIETANLSPGVYLLQTSKNGKTYSLKFTKQ